jgi:hypothetical protein
MNLSFREKLIAVAAVSMVILLALDHFVISGLSERLKAVAEESGSVETAIATSTELIDRDSATRGKWKVVEASLTGLGDESAENRLVDHLNSLARSAGASVSSTQLSKVQERSEFHEISMDLRMEGSIQALEKMLHSMACSPYMLRPSRLAVFARTAKPGVMNIEMRVSCLKMQGDGKAPSTPPPCAVTPLPLEEYKKIHVNNIFSHVRKADPAPQQETPVTQVQPDKPVTPPAPKPTAILTGVVYDGSTGVCIAIFENRTTGQTSIIKVGETVEKGTVQAIDMEKVTIKFGEEVREMPLGDAIYAEGVQPVEAQPDAGAIVQPQPGATAPVAPAKTTEVIERLKQKRLEEEKELEKQGANTGPGTDTPQAQPNTPQSTDPAAAEVLERLRRKRLEQEKREKEKQGQPDQK